MDLGEAKEIYNKHVDYLMRTSKDGDELVKALNLLQYHINDTISDTIEMNTKENLWKDTNIDLLIAQNNGIFEIYQKGIKINNVQELELKYNNEKMTELKITQFI